MLIDIIAGARPNFVKISPIINALKKAQSGGFDVRYRLIHTGQHYDPKLSGSFFEQLDIPFPDVNLEVGSGTQAQQTGQIMAKYEQLLLNLPSNYCLVVGDVNSTLATSIVAKKMGIKIIHVEAGIRSGDLNMPEEINRIVTDAITDYFFTTTKQAGQNLKNSGISDDRIFFVGNTMIDTLLNQMHKLIEPPFFKQLSLVKNEYIVLTLHRPSNVDQSENLISLLKAVVQASKGMKIIFPVHPRTFKVLSQVDFSSEYLNLVEPLSYLEFNYLVKYAKAVITDSGGVTEETTVMGIPCMTLRNTTERPETCVIGTNELLGTNPEAIKPAMETLFAGKWKKGSIPEKWDGKTSERIVIELQKIFAKGL
ncbi:MAG: UDP-N-acetylglucosamine 2-epimerase (non-hydrolyzing) [Bacteroidota bacterium]